MQSERLQKQTAIALPLRSVVAGLDLARRSDHSALVLLDAAPNRLTVTAALRLPQAPLRQQFALIAPHLAGLRDEEAIVQVQFTGPGRTDYINPADDPRKK